MATAKKLKIPHDEFVGDIIPLEIDADMSVSALYAIETIFYLRLQLEQVLWSEDEPLYEKLCRNRFEQIAEILKKKYSLAKAVNEKIEILERLSAIGDVICREYSYLAIEEATKLKETANLTYAQKLRLDWISSINFEDESHIVAELLPQTNTAFEMATLAIITDFISKEEREAVLSRYFKLYNVALCAKDASELGKLLTLAAYWNSDPTIRSRLIEVTNCVQSFEEISLPERCVNQIAAIVYTQIDTLTGKYEEIPA